jgi:hypothetical protein
MTITTDNVLLRSLTPFDATLLAPHLTRISVAANDTVVVPGTAHAFVYFPETAIAAFAEMLTDRTLLYIGLIGPEGCIGWPALLGCPIAHDRGTIEMRDGTLLRMPAATLLELCSISPSLRARLLCFVRTYTIQMARTIAANLRGPVEQRLARWLLMLHDRIDGDEMQITHDRLAEALNVRRASITDSLHVLEGHRALRSSRGHLVIRDRPGLEQLAGECYGVAEAAYCRMIAPFGKSFSADAERPRTEPARQRGNAEQRA